MKKCLLLLVVIGSIKSMDKEREPLVINATYNQMVIAYQMLDEIKNNKELNKIPQVQLFEKIDSKNSSMVNKEKIKRNAEKLKNWCICCISCPCVTCSQWCCENN